MVIVVSDEDVISFTKIVETYDYDHANDSNLKRTETFKKDLKKREDETRTPPLALPADENEEKEME